MSTYTESLGLELITPGSQAGLWGNTTNNSLNLIDQAITGVTPISFAGAGNTTKTLTDYNGAEDEARAAVLNVTGIATDTNTIIIPNKQKTYYVRNATQKDIVVQTSVGTTPCTVGAGYNLPVFCDGNNNVFLAILAPGAGTLTVSGGGTGVTTFGAGGFVKSSGSTNALSASSTVALGSEVSGTLPVSNGGTGKATLTSGALLFGQGTSAIGEFVGGSSGQVATWNGSAWVAQAPTTSGITSISAGTGVTVNGGAGPITSGSVTIAATGGGMVYPSTGIPYSTGSAWGTSYNSSSPIPTAYGGTGNTTGTATDSAKLGSYSASDYARYAVSSSSWSGLQSTTTGAATNLGWATTYGGITSGMSSKSVQVGYTNQGITSASYNTISMFNPSGTYVAVANNDMEFSGSGNAYKPGGGSWAATSDARLKENVTPLTGALDKISSLNPVTYNWKYETGEPTTGFIAQEVEAIIPTAVSKTTPTDKQKPFITDDVLYSLGWQNDMIAYLVGAIKELKAEVDALKASK